MKTNVSIKPITAFGLLKSLFLAVILLACSEPEVTPVRPNASSKTPDDELRESSDARLFCPPKGPNYNLNVILHSVKKSWSFGFIKFRQYENETQLIHLDTWVHDLQPNTSYLLQRAVDTTLDGDCTGTAWLTLGKGLEPQSILTDSRGSGKAELFRSVAAIPVGSTFDIHFQIIKESTSEVVLTSDCYEYTVR